LYTYNALQLDKLMLAVKIIHRSIIQI